MSTLRVHPKTLQTPVKYHSVLGSMCLSKEIVTAS